jgi:hypothetical protein
MVGMRQSESEQTLTFSAAPADVATAIEAALASVGEVKQVDQATGRIAGKIKQGLHGFDSAATVEFLVSSSGAMTQVQIQTTRDEGAISMHGAEKGMDIILAALQAQPGLKGTSSAGW